MSITWYVQSIYTSPIDRQEGVKRGKTKGEAANRKTKKVQEKKNTLEEHPLNQLITPLSSPSSSLGRAAAWIHRPRIINRHTIHPHLKYHLRAFLWCIVVSVASGCSNPNRDPKLSWRIKKIKNITKEYTKNKLMTK